jgi:hypothetical protein
MEPMCKEYRVMKQTILFLTAVILFTVSSQVHAALTFKMNADKTTLALGDIASIEIFAYANDPLATGQNGVNSWQISLLVSGSGVVQVVDGSIAVTAPFPNDFLTSGINSPSGSISDLAMNAKTIPVNSTLGVGGYTKIAEFQIVGVNVGQATYSIADGGLGFFGILRDYNPVNPGTWGNYLDGTFDAGASDRVFSIVPEPATFALLGGLGFFLLRSRKSGRL